MHRYGGEEVVCTCGAYFRTDYVRLGTALPQTATARWAQHYRNAGPRSLDDLPYLVTEDITGSITIDVTHVDRVYLDPPAVQPVPVT